MDTITPESRPGPEDRASLGRRTVRRVIPYLFRRRRILALTILCMVVYSVSVNARNLIPAIFFDGVLVPDTGGGSVVWEFLRPVSRWLGGVRPAAERPYTHSGVPFDRLEVTLTGTSSSLSEEALREARRAGKIELRDGIASYSGRIGASPYSFRDRKFTSLRAEFAPGSALDWRGADRSLRIPAGSLRLEYKPTTLAWGLLRFIVIFGLVVCLLIAASRFLQSYLVGYLIQNILADLRRDLIEHMASLSLSFFGEKSRGDLLSRIARDLTVVTNSLQIIFTDLVQKPITLLIAVVVIFWINWWLALIAIGFFPFLFVAVARFGRQVRRRSHRQSSKAGIMTTALEQLFSGIRTVKSFNMESYEKKHFEEKNQAVVKEGLRTIRAKVLSNSLVELAAHAGVIVALGIGGYFLIGGELELSIGDLIAFTAALNTMYTPVKSLARAYSVFQESIGAMERVTEIFETRSTVREAPDASPLPAFRSSIRYEGVHFSYGREKVLESIDLEFSAGRLTAVVGPTGAGKSTLVDLLLRFYDPTAGRILVDGTDIRTVTLDSLTAQISIVSQDPFLFDTTIRNNILYGRPGATDEEIEEAARAANVHDFIASLPAGYQTEIGDRGTQLSGGQRQRITIARSLLKNAPILILDEATSNLDAESEAAVQSALERLIRVRSTIAIAHRLSTIRKADKIIVLDRGRIVEQGDYHDLLRRRGLFYRLYSKQFEHAGGDGSGGVPDVA